MYWLLGRQSQLSLENKVLLYKAIIKPIWTYGIELWGTASMSNIQIIERVQSKILRIIVNAPFYVRNINIRNDLQISAVTEEVRINSIKHLNKIAEHPNKLVYKMLRGNDNTRRLKRHIPEGLPTRFKQ